MGTKAFGKPRWTEFNAIIKMTKIIDAVEKWGAAFEEKYIYEVRDRSAAAERSISAASRGGAPYRPNYYPGPLLNLCRHTYAAAGAFPVTIQNEELERVLNGLGIGGTTSTFTNPLLGHEGKQVKPLVGSAEEVHQYLFGGKIKSESPDRASIWTDTNVYNEIGIPCIKIGPRGKRVARQEEIEIDVMLNAAKIYALMALDICSRAAPGRKARSPRRSVHSAAAGSASSIFAVTAPGRPCF